MGPRALTQAWFDRVWNRQDDTAVHEMLPDHAEIHGLGPEPVRGAEAFLAFRKAFIQSFKAINIELIELKEQNDEAFGHGVFTGIHRRTETPVTIEFSFSGRWRDGQIVEARNVIDYLPMLSQLQVFGHEALMEVFKTEP